MLTDKELADIEISTDVVEFALDQVSQRLAYAERVQAMLELRATNFLKFFFGLAVAGIGAASGLVKADVINASALVLSAGFLPLAVSCACLVAALWDKTRGAPGSDASWWLAADTIGLDADGLAYMKALLMRSYQGGVDVAYKSNYETVLLIRWSLVLATLTPVALMLAVRLA